MLTFIKYSNKVELPALALISNSFYKLPIVNPLAFPIVVP